MKGDLLSRLGYFEGNLEDALVHAGPLHGPLDIPGFPLGVTDDSAKSRVGVDFTLHRWQDGDLGNKSIGVIGLQGIGKTFMLNVMMYMWAAESAGQYSGSIQIDSLKHNNMGEPETAPLISKLLGCTVIEVSKISLNPLSKLWDFTYDEQYELVKTMIQVRRKTTLKDVEEELLDIHLRASYDSEEDSSFVELADSIQDYRADRDRYTEAQATHLEHLALDLSAAVRNLTRGKLGKIFKKHTHDDELLKLIEQQAKSWDFKDIKDDVRSVIEVFRGMIEMSALSLKDPEDPLSGPKHPERVAQYIGRDEAYDAWGNEQFSNFEFTRMKTLRERDLTLMMCFHRLADFLDSVGTAKARNVIREIPIWLIGRQTKADLKDIRDFLHLPEFVVQSLTTLPKGHFWLIIPSGARLITVLGTELEIKTFVTNQANEALLQMYFETGDLQYYMDWLEETTPREEEKDSQQVIPAEILSASTA
jgi:hypothetical protein